MDQLGNPLLLLLSIIVFITGIAIGIKRGKKAGIKVLSIFWLIVATQLFLILLSLIKHLPAQGMGWPELMGQLVGSLLMITMFGYFLTAIAILVLGIVKFNKSDLLVEIVFLLISAMLIHGAHGVQKTFHEMGKASQPPLSPFE